VSTPHDPDDDAAASGNDDLSGGVSADEAAWRSIIDNYGDRPELAEEPEVEVPPSPRGVYPEDEAPELEPVEAEDHFVPPPPPPLPMPEPRRLLAWLGLFGVPIFVLVCLLTGLDLPTWLGLILMVWFVGGFVYLVASMRPGAGDDYNDGAVL
jgi:hypothetical protein